MAIKRHIMIIGSPGIGTSALISTLLARIEDDKMDLIVCQSPQPKVTPRPPIIIEAMPEMDYRKMDFMPPANEKFYHRYQKMRKKKRK